MRGSIGAVNLVQDKVNDVGGGNSSRLREGVNGTRTIRLGGGVGGVWREVGVFEELKDGFEVFVHPPGGSGRREKCVMSEAKRG